MWRGVGVAVAVAAALAIAAFDTWHTTGPIVYAGYAARSPSAFRRASPAVLGSHPPAAAEAARTAFVTGASGFLGAHVVEQLALAGWPEITCMHRTGSNTRVLLQLQARFGADRIRLVTGDVTDRASLSRAIPASVGAVFHVAAGIGLWARDRERNYATNVLGTRNLVDAALERGAARFVHTSSIAVFPPVAAAAGAAAGGVAVNESYPHAARAHWSGYGSTKALAEDEVRAGIADGLWAVVLNPGAIIGKYDVASFGQISRLVKNRAVPSWLR
jgi:dihydroflavonol-4-reductase